MNEKLASLEQETEPTTHQQKIPIERTKDPSTFRVDPRRATRIQTLVSIPTVRTRAYFLRDMSRSGMFLTYRDRRTCTLEIEQYGIECGTHAEIAFIATTEEAKEHCNVHGQIVRITREGIGVAFITHNPPQLAKLREFFSFSEEEVKAGVGG